MYIPSDRTLVKYGLSEKDFKRIGKRQEWKCPICERRFSDTVKPVIDHEHIKNWKKLIPNQRKRYVRGLLCAYCNLRRVGRGINLKIAENVVAYLKSYHERLNESS